MGVQYSFRITPYVSLESNTPTDLGPTSEVLDQYMAVAPFDRVFVFYFFPPLKRPNNYI